MTIVPAAVLTTTQLVGGLVASAKNALDLAKASSDHTLKASISELYDGLLDVKARVLDLDEEVRRLKAELARKDEFIGPIEPHGYFFYKPRPDEPLCPKCFQASPQRPVFLSLLTKLDGGEYRHCLQCGFDNWEKPRPHSSDSVAVGRPSLFHQSRGYV